jgi:hypothetical protein
VNVWSVVTGHTIIWRVCLYTSDRYCCAMIHHLRVWRSNISAYIHTYVWCRRQHMLTSYTTRKLIHMMCIIDMGVADRGEWTNLNRQVSWCAWGALTHVGVMVWLHDILNLLGFIEREFVHWLVGVIWFLVYSGFIGFIGFLVETTHTHVFSIALQTPLHRACTWSHTWSITTRNTQFNHCICNNWCYGWSLYS